MNEFNNRIDAQRQILTLVNSKRRVEELYGLSSAAIERWLQANSINSSGRLALAIYESADKLFFLANKSQEQITDEYRMLSREVAELAERIADLCSGSRAD
ncbi:hypothetical protein Jab_2c30730 [Janthinobacterium sp. HH01]|uniref:hypothetical protein n=1 Tax=Janthinobacterium sp. HH01 TaxID=1198452 RepID=UPI0002AEC3A6|nr:hypothetical protein [Janthinobacterium sp. HH01]ELX10971.1 hypothetical protein Jab_2c30730 [Janthinobacterium sp. HH01]